jgi:hypothetical protein
MGTPLSSKRAEPYSDAKIANRLVRGDREWTLERWANPKLSRRTCTCEYGLGTGYSRGEGNRRASRNGLVSVSHPKALTLRFATRFISLHADGETGEDQPSSYLVPLVGLLLHLVLLMCLVVRLHQMQVRARRGTGGSLRDGGLRLAEHPLLLLLLRLHSLAAAPA